MNPIKVKLNLLKRHFEELIITCDKVVIFYDAGEFPDLHPTYKQLPVLVTAYDGRPLAKFKEIFTIVREEIDQNISLIRNDNELVLYLRGILEFYQTIDNQIKEDDGVKLACQAFKLKNIAKNTFYSTEYPTYQEFLRETKLVIRNEYQYIMGKHDKLVSKHEKSIGEQLKGSELTWTKNINDLVELVRALKLSGSINNSSNNLTFDEAYRYFGNLFGIEIKRPEDQLRQKAETMNKQFFLEELTEVFQKDMKELMRRRMQ